VNEPPELCLIGSQHSPRQFFANSNVQRLNTVAITEQFWKQAAKFVEQIGALSHLLL